MTEKRKKAERKRLGFAGYTFDAGPDGTTIHREVVQRPSFSEGDRVSYTDVNLWGQRGTVVSQGKRWVLVRWDRHPTFTSEEDPAQLRKWEEAKPRRPGASEEVT